MEMPVKKGFLEEKWKYISNDFWQKDTEPFVQFQFEWIYEKKRFSIHTFQYGYLVTTSY